VGLHGLDRGGRRVVGPERVDEAVDRDDLLGAEQQQCQHRTLRPNAQIDRPLTVENLEGTKDAEVHCSPTLAEPQPDRNRVGLDRTRQPSAKETHMRKFPQPRFGRVGLRIAALVLLAAAAAATGCGGDDEDKGPTKQAFIAKADAICAEANKKEAALNPGEIGWHYGDRFEDSAFLSKFTAPGQDALRQLKALEPPKDDRQQMAAVLSSLQALVGALDEQAADARAGRRQASANVTAYERAYADLAIAAGQAGLTECQGVAV
jgi:hypothetical protein